jgi:hypothetical protein
MRKTLRREKCSKFLLASTIALLSAPFALAQDTASQGLPDSPSYSSSLDAQQPPGQATEHVDPQQKRIFGILPNFRAVSAGTVLPPQTVKEKFSTTVQDSFDYSAFILAGLVAGEADAARDTPEFGHGAIAYSRYYWHAFADQTDENLWVEFIIPSVMHEDTRYYSLGKGGFVHRAGYALSRIAITRRDNGKGNTFNSSEIVGAGISSAISNLYYPSPERTFGNTMDKYGVNLGIDAVAFAFREFYPDIYHGLFHKKTETP